MSRRSDNNEFEADIESQASDSLGSTASRKSNNSTKSPKLRPYPVGMNMTEGQFENFKKKYLIEPILSRSEVPHMHPYLAYERDRLELEALKCIGRTPFVVDVGSGARRHAHYNLHCLCPYLQPGDQRRLQEGIRNGNSICSHRLQDWCTCHGSTPDTFLFVHSAYYIPVHDLVEAINKSTHRCIYVVGHLFDEAFGSLGDGEAQYRVNLKSASPEIIMKVSGNAHEYRHPPLPWDGEEAHYNGRALFVELITKLGDTCLWRVCLGNEYLPRIPVDWQSACVDITQIGPVHVPGWDSVTKQALTRNSVLEVEVDCVYGKGKYLMGSTRSGRVYIPKDLVSATARHFHGRVRDPALMLDVIHYVKRGLASSRIPEHERLMSQTVIAAMAFNLNVRNEIDVTNTIVSRYSAVWKMHEILTTLTPLRVCSWVTIVWWGCFFLGLSLVYLFLGPAYRLELGAGSIAVTSMVVALFWAAFMYKRWQSRRTTDNWSSTLFHEEEVSHITGGISSSLARTAFPPYSQLRAPLIPPHGAILEVGPDPCPPKHPGSIRPVMNLGGIGFSTAVPTAPRTDQDSEITAITHRILRSDTVVKRHAVEKFYDLTTTPEGRRLLAMRVVGSQTMYLDWINQPKFSLGQRNKFLKAYNEEVRNDKEPKLGTHFNTFAKFEKLKVLTQESIEALKTRLINGPPDAVKVAVGPWTARLYKELKEAWNGRDCRILYASGMTPDEIGRRCDEFAETHGGWDNMMGVWDDCTAYDSTLQNDLLAIREQLYPAIGFPALTMKWMMSTGSSGLSKHGVKFKLGKKVCWDGVIRDIRILFSGEMDTNIIGTIVNGLAHSSGLPDTPYLMLVCGDDSFILFPKDTQELFQVASNLRDHLVDLGLEPTQGISPHRGDWEFCSKLFWPAIDKQTGAVRTVLGPKPGRWLHRIGWSLTKPDSQNFRSAMLSSMADVAHIPLLSTYVTVGLALSHGQKARGKEDYSELKHVTKAYQQHPFALTMLHERYGLTAQSVLAFCETLKLCKVAPCVFECSWIEAAAKRDEE